jgi:chemosensory pili system protein ChpA (sensor histidine kinase/response regulator)
MSDLLPPFDESELSPEDLAVLRAFEAMDDWNVEPSASPELLTQSDKAAGKQQNVEISEDEMFALFVGEIDGDIARMQGVLNQLELDDHIDPARFVTLKRAAHKIRGTAGAMECQVLATLAEHIEEISEQIMQGAIFPLLGAHLLARAVSALEETSHGLAANKQESNAALKAFEDELSAFEAEFNALTSDQQQPSAFSELLGTSIDTAPRRSPSRHLAEAAAAWYAPAAPLVRVDAQRMERLALHAEQLTQKRSELENALAQVESALQELHLAQARLHQLAPMLSSLLTPVQPLYMLDTRPTSSLIARILSEATQRSDATPGRQSRPRSRFARMTDSERWDELDMESYSEKDILLRSLNEAIADVTTASAHVRSAFAHFHLILQGCMAHASLLRSDALLLRMAPLRILFLRLQQEVMMSAMEQEQKIHFEIAGDSIEIDQDILEALTDPLLQLLRTCTSDIFTERVPAEGVEPYRIWLRARELGSEIAIEIGFSMTIQGGALEEVREAIRRLHGAISPSRNASGGVSYHMRFPRAHGAVHCLLVRVGSEQVIVPFSQVQRIGEGKQEKIDILYQFNDLLGFPRVLTPAGRVQPILILLQEGSRTTVGIAVDEIVGEVELEVKPLAAYLQRPGITGAAIDGLGRVLLMIDLPALIRHYAVLQQHVAATMPQPEQTLAQLAHRLRILIADDSVYLRQSLLQVLAHANYEVMEAPDGMKAMEQLMEHTPDVFLLDIEMPNLNGYDVLSLMRLYPELAGVKIIMLTSRSSEKHLQRALDLGAHAYLTKPCPREVLLDTIQQLTGK